MIGPRRVKAAKSLEKGKKHPSLVLLKINREVFSGLKTKLVKTFLRCWAHDTNEK